MANYFEKVTYCFLFLGILLIPFSYDLFPIHTKLINGIFADLCAKIFTNWSGIVLKNTQITSDSTTMFVLIFLLIGASFLISFLPNIFKRWNFRPEKIYGILNLIFTFFLALILLKYGFQKLFKWQFYLPEPNILYTPFGKLDKDILFWSTMGISRSYCIFMGILEIIPAILVLFRRTRLVGLLISLPVLINIVAINFSFDISVKIFSLFLLLLNLFFLFPHLKTLFQFLILNEKTALPKPFIFLKKQPVLKIILKTFIIGIVFLEALFPYLKTMNFNDDLATRPYLHGAYQVEEILKNEQQISLDSFPIKRIFIHRDGYLILQNKEEEMQDLKLIIDAQQEQILITDYLLRQYQLEFKFLVKDSILIMDYPYKNQKVQLKMKQLNWQELPALKNQFHWNVESIK